MKLGSPLKRLRGLKTRFTIVSLLLGGLCIFLFVIMNLISGKYLEKYCNSDSFLQKTTMHYVESMQKYATRNDLGMEDVDAIVAWARKQPMVYMELFRDKQCVYSTVYDSISWYVNAENENNIDSVDVQLSENTSDTGEATIVYDNARDEDVEEDYEYLIQAPQIISDEDEEDGEFVNGLSHIYLEDWEQSFGLKMRDGQLDVVMYLNVTSRYKNVATVIEVILCAVLYIFLFSQINRKMIAYICQLKTEVQLLEGGNLEYPISVQGNDELTDLAVSMNSMRMAFKEQVEQEAAMHEANKNLITEMSHDLRTPLTSLLLYTEILRGGKYTSETQLQEYLEKIDSKAHQIKQLSDNIFSYSLSNQERKSDEKQPKRLDKFFKNVLQEGMEDLEKEGFTFDCNLKWEPCYCLLRQDYAERIVNNVISNLQKYAEKKVPIHVETVYTEDACGLSFFNTIKEEQEIDTESNGIGLKSVRSMVEEMEGSCMVEQTDIGFSFMVLFPIC